MTKEERRELCESLALWANRFTEEVINKEIIPNVDKALDNPFVVHYIRKWRKEHDNEEYDIRELTDRFSGEPAHYGRPKKFTRTPLSDSRDSSNALYEFFIRLCREEKEKEKEEKEDGESNT